MGSGVWEVRPSGENCNRKKNRTEFTLFGENTHYPIKNSDTLPISGSFTPPSGSDHAHITLTRSGGRDFWTRPTAFQVVAAWVSIGEDPGRRSFHNLL